MTRYYTSLLLYYLGCAAGWLANHTVPFMARAYQYLMIGSFKLDKNEQVWERVE